jgi:hypothetical protein
MGSFGVRTRQAFARSTATISISSPRTPNSSADVTTIVDGFCSAQPFELEMIGRDDIGKRAQEVTHQRRDVGVDEQAPVAIPEHGVATIEQSGIAGLGARDEVRNHSGDLRRAEITRQDHLTSIDRAALLDPEQEIGDKLCFQHPAADGRVTRPVAQQGGGHRDHIDAVHLHGKDGGAVADMAVRDLGLDGDDGHGMGAGTSVFERVGRNRVAQCTWI